MKQTDRIIKILIEKNASRNEEMHQEKCREMRNAKVNNNNKYFQSYSKVLLCFPSKVRHKIPELANLYDLHLVKLYLR